MRTAGATTACDRKVSRPASQSASMATTVCDGRLDDRRNPKHNYRRYMIRPAFSVVMPDGSLAMGGELHTEVIA
jgi:hypothetical protein